MENREPTFEQSFRECCIRSCNYLAHEREQTDKRYKEVSRECNELYRMIQERLGDEEILLNRFDAAKNYENAINYFSKAFEYFDSYAYKLMCFASYYKMGEKLKAKEFLTPYLKKMDKETAEYQLVRFFCDNYSKNAETSLIQKINKEDNSTKRGKMLFYMGLYYELMGADVLANEYYGKVIAMQAPMFFEYRIAEWGLGS